MGYLQPCDVNLIPRTVGTASIALSGSLTTNDVLTATFSAPFLTSPIIAAATVAAGDTLASLMAKLATAVEAAFQTRNSSNVELSASAIGVSINLGWAGPLGSLVTISTSVSGAASEVLAVTQFSGGTGWVTTPGDPPGVANDYGYPLNNPPTSGFGSAPEYRFMAQGADCILKAGRPYALTNAQLAAAVAAGVPIS